MHKHSNYRGPRRRRGKETDDKICEEIIVENFPVMGQEIVNQVQETQRVQYRVNPRRNRKRHILIKLSYKEEILKQQGKSNKQHKRKSP